jgi:glycine cleavage system regulatory protein
MKIGDKVTLKSYIEFNHADAPGIVREMLKFFGGKEVTITELYADRFKIKED